MTEDELKDKLEELDRLSTMTVEFRDEQKKDEHLYICELISPPRIGDCVRIDTCNNYVGEVVEVWWDIGGIVSSHMAIVVCRSEFESCGGGTTNTKGGDLRIVNNLDYIRVGLAAKSKWPEIDFGAVEIVRIPFGKSRFEFPVMTDKVEAQWIDCDDSLDYPQLKKEIVDARCWRIGETEFMVGYGFNKLLVGIKE